MQNLTKIMLSVIICCTALSLHIQARVNHRYDRDGYNRRHRRYHHHDPYRGERMAKGTLGGAATGAFIGGLAGGGRGAGIGFGVGALTGLMAGAAASESHRHDYYEEDYDDYSEEPRRRQVELETDQEEVESREASASEEANH